jgi:hypothetical protein
MGRKYAYRREESVLKCEKSLRALFSVLNYLRMIGVLGFDSRQGLGTFLFTTASRPALGPTQPPIQWVPVSLSLEVNRPGNEADHSLPSSAEVNERVELYLHSSNTPPWRGAQLKHRVRRNFILHLVYISISSLLKIMSFRTKNSLDIPMLH